jgi:hypothetical protein
VFGISNVNMFINFLITYLRCYFSSFLKVNITKFNQSHNEWITRGIKVFCKRKKELFVLCKISNNHNLKLYYKKYCLILTKIICNAKKLHYNNIILRFKNKIKITWKIINSEREITHQDTSVPLLELDDKIITNQLKIANLCNSYFLAVADSINVNKNKDVNSTMINPITRGDPKKREDFSGGERDVISACSRLVHVRDCPPHQLAKQCPLTKGL